MQIGSRFTIGVHIITAIDYFKDMDRVNSEFLAGSIGVNPVIVRTVISQLREAGIVQTLRGSSGAELCRRLDEITLYDVYKAVGSVDVKEGLFHMHEQPNPDCPVGRNIHQVLDVVVSRNVTWNLPHPEQAYAEWLRVLKSGGLLLNYDAEYGKYHHGDFQREAVYAHKDLTEDLVEQCHQIYHMLDISMYDRPRWDLEILQRLGAKNCTADITVGPRLYAQKDSFYAPAPFFGVFARK